MSLKKHTYNTFIPHRHNGYRPHAIRHYGLLTTAALLILLQGLFNYQTAGSFQVLGYATNVTIGDLLSLTNSNRSSSGLSSLSLNSKLNSAAQSKAQHMITNDYWAHTAPDGTTPWYFIGNAGYSYDKAGENLAYGFSTSNGVVQGWMDSPSHRANILDSQYQDVGFGIANGSDYQGGENTVVVAMYGDPVSAPAPAPEPEPAPSSPPAATTQSSSPAAPTPVAAAEPTPPIEEVEEIIEEPQPEYTLHQSLYLAREDSVFVQSGNLDDTGQVRAETISNFEAVLSGQAHWTLYASMGAIFTLAIIYLMRHAHAIYQVIVHGEHYIVGHPLLEASLIYAVIWIFMASTYGVIL